MIGGSGIDRAGLPAAAERILRRVAATLGRGTTVRFTGHADGSARDPRDERALGLRRAQAVEAIRAAHGAEASSTLVAHGATAPRATNATEGHATTGAPAVDVLAHSASQAAA